MKHLKLFENKNDINTLKELTDKITQLYQNEGIPAVFKCYNYEKEYIFEIIIKGKEINKPIKTLYIIQYFDNDLFFNIQSFQYENIIKDFIKFLIKNYSFNPFENLISWSFDINFNDIPNILKNLSLENFKIYKSAGHYNL